LGLELLQRPRRLDGVPDADEAGEHVVAQRFQKVGRVRGPERVEQPDGLVGAVGGGEAAQRVLGSGGQRFGGTGVVVHHPLSLSPAPAIGAGPACAWEPPAYARPMRRLRTRWTPFSSTRSKVTRCPVRKNRNIPCSMATGSIGHRVSPSSLAIVPVLLSTSYSLTDPCGTWTLPFAPH